MSSVTKNREPSTSQISKEYWQQIGAQGGRATAKKFSKETRREWGKKGGRPRSAPLSHQNDNENSLQAGEPQRMAPSEIIDKSMMRLGFRSYWSVCKRIGICEDTLRKIRNEIRVSRSSIALSAQLFGCRPEDLRPRK